MHQKPQKDNTATAAKNNSNNNNNNQMSSTVIGSDRDNNNNAAYTLEQLPPLVRKSLLECLGTKDLDDYRFDAEVLSGLGENSYGLVLRTKFTLCEPIATATPVPSVCESAATTAASAHSISQSVVKIAPENEPRRTHMQVPEYYAREVFMYDEVFSRYQQLAALTPGGAPFDIAPAFYGACLADCEEFLIVEDLLSCGYRLNGRLRPPSLDLVACAMKAVAKLHGMSFVLRERAPKQFAALLNVQRDALFTETTNPMTWEFGKTSLRRLRSMLARDVRTLALESPAEQAACEKCIELLDNGEDAFEEYALYCVDGSSAAPYAVFCHGDFWNNNILYKFDDANSKAIDAKLIDFQMHRYASPVLDLVHYLYACTEKELRDAHFFEILDTYYESLGAHLASYALDVADIYPKPVFVSQLQEYGAFGLVMSSLALPFFISLASEMLNFDQVYEEMRASAADDSDSSLSMESCRKIIDGNDMLNERTLPILKRRMTGVVRDIIKYNMDEPLYRMSGNGNGSGNKARQRRTSVELPEEQP